MSDPVLELRNVHKHFDQSATLTDDIKNIVLRRGTSQVRAVDGINLEVHENQVHGIIGESGCGKSTLLRTLMGIHDLSEGEIFYRGDPVSGFDPEDWNRFRRNVKIIFQDPFTAINPKFTVRAALREPLRIHGVEPNEDRYYEILEQVHLTPPGEYLDKREAQLSGGEKQRVSIARALILNPDIVLADEPTSMLDVSTQAGVLDLLEELIDDHDIAMVYVSHDLSTVSYICDVINVMYLGRVVESAGTEKLLNEPKHPYTRELLKAIPLPDPHQTRERSQLEATPQDPVDLPQGCRFKDRCPDAMDVCDLRPEYREIEADHWTACHLHYDQEPTVAERRSPERGDS